MKYKNVESSENEPSPAFVFHERMEYSIELFINFIEKTMSPISSFILHLSSFPRWVPITALPNIRCKNANVKRSWKDY